MGNVFCCCFLKEKIGLQGYKKIRLIRSLKKVYIPIPRSYRNISRLCRDDNDLVEIYSVSAETIINDGFLYTCSQQKCQEYFFLS